MAGMPDKFNIWKLADQPSLHPVNCNDSNCCIGFGHLPVQVFKKAVRKGFEFNLLVVGESGLGKSTLINSMFLTNIYSQDTNIRDQTDVTNQLETHRTDLEENGVKLALTVVDTPGFGDAVNNTMISFKEKLKLSELKPPTQESMLVCTS